MLQWNIRMLLPFKINIECYGVLLHKGAHLKRYGNVAGKHTIFFRIPQRRRMKQNPLDGRLIDSVKASIKRIRAWKVLLTFAFVELVLICASEI